MTNHQSIDDTAEKPSLESTHPAPRGAAQSDPSVWSGLKAGDTVPGLSVTVGEILLKTDEAFVFLNTEGGVEWLFNQTAPDNAWAYARVVGLEARCAHKAFMDRSVPKWYHKWFFHDYRTHERSAKRFIAQGIVILLMGGTKEEAERAFQSAEDFIVQRGREVSLNWLYATFGLLAVVSAIALITLVKTKPHSDIFWAALTCAAAGGVGAYISRALASRQDIPRDANAGHRLHRAEAILRWSVGVVAGALVCLLVQGKVLLGGLPLDNVGFPVVLALATLAGMSERFLPTLLDHFNSKLSETESK
jgi:hypothetical protein